VKYSYIAFHLFNICIRMSIIVLTIMTSFFIFLILTLTQSENDRLYGVESGSHLPTISDRNLKVQLIYEGKFEFEPNQISPVSSFTFFGNDILVLSKNKGTVNRIVNGTMLEEPLLDVNVANKRERGMLGITTSAPIGSNVIPFFLYYTETKKMDGTDICPKTYYCIPGSDKVENRLYRYEYVDNKLINPKLLLRLPAEPGPSHNGGALRIGPDNNIYITIGDLVGSVNKTSSTRAQNFKTGTNPDGRAGILQITQDGKPASAGPLLGKEFPLNLYFAYGIRNSFGIDFDPITGNLWDTENGPEYGDEINMVEPGFNSGWITIQGEWKPTASSDPNRDLVAGNKVLNYSSLTTFEGKGKYSPPEFTWRNTVGPTSLKFLDSNKLGKKYENDIFVGSVNLGTIFHFDLNSARKDLNLKGALEDKVADNHNELKDIIFGEGFSKITDIEVGPDGYLYILSYKGQSYNIYRVVPKDLN